MGPDSLCLRLLKRATYRVAHAWRQPHTIESNCSGVRLRYSSRNRIAEEIFANAFERAERQLLDRILYPGMTVVDIGANLGLYSCLFAQRVGPTGQVIAFEPTPSTFAALQKNIAINGYQNIVQLRQCALSDHSGTASMNTFAEGNDVYNSFGVTSTVGGSKAQGMIAVPTTTLDESLRIDDVRTGAFIKIDVEGFEYQVIRGGASLLNKATDLIMMIELNEPASKQCGSSTVNTLDLMQSFGFDAYYMSDVCGLTQFKQKNRSDLIEGRLPQDVFFFKPSMRPNWLK